MMIILSTGIFTGVIVPMTFARLSVISQISLRHDAQDGTSGVNYKYYIYRRLFKVKDQGDYVLVYSP